MLILISYFSSSCSDVADSNPCECSDKQTNSYFEPHVLGRDSEREFFQEEIDSRIYYRMLDVSSEEAKMIISYENELAYPQYNSKFNTNGPKETVLNANETLIFENSNGSGSISYVSALVRKYELNNGINRKITMIARPDRFLGERGIYDPASRFFFEFWKPSPRMVVSEANIYFDTIETALQYMRIGKAIDDWVHNEDGYVLGYSETPYRDQVGVTLYRYYIDGKPALKMPGYNNEKLILKKKSRGQATFLD